MRTRIKFCSGKQGRYTPVEAIGKDHVDVAQKENSGTGSKRCATMFARGLLDLSTRVWDLAGSLTWMVCAVNLFFIFISPGELMDSSFSVAGRPWVYMHISQSGKYFSLHVSTQAAQFHDASHLEVACYVLTCPVCLLTPCGTQIELRIPLASHLCHTMLPINSSGPLLAHLPFPRKA